MDQTTVLLTRWLGVIFGAGLSYEMIQLVAQNRLQYYLADQKFQLLVIFGGVLLAAIVFLKLLSLSSQAGGHHHHHDHGHDHGHHHDHGHSHGDNGHDHNPALWRYIVLAFPMMILLLGMAPTGLSEDVLMQRSTKDLQEAIGKVKLPPGKKVAGDPVLAQWQELEQGRFDAAKRDYWNKFDHPIQITGQFVPADFDDRYRLMRIKITCCAADATPLGVSVIDTVSDWKQQKWKYGQWIEVIGAVSYTEVPDEATGTTQYYPLVHAISVTMTEPKPYVQ